jgi:all-trans-8'-apo-beta-carotenal 15,15'-oxygenase
MQTPLQTNRRQFLGGLAALSALPITPERAIAAAAAEAALDWGIAFADLETDLAPRPMSLVHGKAPTGLAGTLYRNGGAKFHRPKSSATHWFDGDGLIRAFRIKDGQATLSARFVDTPKRRNDVAANGVISSGFGTAAGPNARITSPDDVNAANISVIRRGEQLWALWEAGSPTAIDPVTLDTVGMVTLRDDLAHMPFLAHPRFEPDGRIWNLGQSGDRGIIWQIGPKGELQGATPIALPRASYIHDFTMSERHILIVLQPWVYTGRSTVPLEALHWQPSLGTQILILDKANLSSRRIVELPPFFAFHMTEAYEAPSGDIRFGICASADPGFPIRTAVDAMSRKFTPASDPKLSLITIPSKGSARIESTTITAEFPQTDHRFGLSPRRFTCHATIQAQNRPLFQGVGVYDWAKSHRAVFDFGADHVVEEMVFTPRPDSIDEFDGWMIGTSLNLRAGRTELHIFEARHIADGPIATWAADIAVPVGLHGIFAAL